MSPMTARTTRWCLTSMASHQLARKGKADCLSQLRKENHQEASSLDAYVTTIGSIDDVDKSAAC
jgi:hypothetical protein